MFQWGWFAVGVHTHRLVVQTLPTARLLFVQCHADAPLAGATLVIIAVGLWRPSGSLAAYFKPQALPANYCAWLVAILLGNGFPTTVMHQFHRRCFGWH